MANEDVRITFLLTDYPIKLLCEAMDALGRWLHPEVEAIAYEVRYVPYVEFNKDREEQHVAESMLEGSRHPDFCHHSSRRVLGEERVHKRRGWE